MGLEVLLRAPRRFAMSAPAFVHEQTLDRFFDRLRVETDPDRRRILRYLAIAEEDRYAEVQGRLDRVDTWIDDGEARIERQRRLVAGFDADSPHRDVAQTLLSNLEELQELLVKFRDALRDAERTAP
jgi:G3E family GTPase